jgi:hypothetical protein
VTFAYSPSFMQPNYCLQSLQRKLVRNTDIDTDKVDEAALALLYLTLHDRVRAWKGIDWDVLGRLCDKGLIEDPVGKQKSVVFTDAGLREAERCLRVLFAKTR